MQRGEELEQKIFEPKHIQQVLAEINTNFPGYFAGFSVQPLDQVFKHTIEEVEKEQPSYREYTDLRTLAEFEDNPNAFKRETKAKCPIIRRCLMSTDDIMKQYKISFNNITGRGLLTGVKILQTLAWNMQRILTMRSMNKSLLMKS